MTTIAIEAWSHVIVLVSDLEKSVEFYKKHLGFEPVGEFDLSGEKLDRILSGNTGNKISNVKGRLVMGRIGGQHVELICYESEDKEVLPPPGIGGFTLRVRDIEGAYHAALQSGLNPQTEPIEIEGSRQFFIADPDGISIEFTQPPAEMS